MPLGLSPSPGAIVHHESFRPGESVENLNVRPVSPSTTTGSTALPTSPWRCRAPEARRSPDLAGNGDRSRFSASVVAVVLADASNPHVATAFTAARRVAFPPMLLAAAAPWFYWLGMVLFLGSIFGVIAAMIGYYVKVIANKSPRRERR
jgi:hypothetical protein